MSFNLDKAIDTWRSMLGRRQAFFGEDVEELEGHMRDHIAQLMRQGLNEAQAFREAQAKMGEFSHLENAYKQVYWRKLKHRRMLLDKLLYQGSMLKSYLILAFRNIVKHKGYSAINISGLAVGLTCCFFIFLWIQNELSIDRFHEKGSRLFQVKIDERGGDRVSTWSNVPMPLATILESDFPEIEHAILTLPVKAALGSQDYASREAGFYAGIDFFEAFSFPLIAGDPSRVLADPSSIVISEAVAEKHFGMNWRERGDVLGQPLRLDYWQSDGGVLGQAVTVNSEKDFTVSGVFEEVRRNSSLRFDFILPVEVVAQQFPHVREWGPRWFELTLGLLPDVDANSFVKKIEPVLQQHVKEAGSHFITLQSFGENYLHSANENGKDTPGRIQQVYIIGLIGLAILLIACINFANLVTARAGQRAREIGVRKALGATPSSLAQQFLGEAVLTVIAAFVLAVGLLIASLPMFNAITGSAVVVSDLSAEIWLTFMGIALLTGLAAGSYPAFYLATRHVLEVFRSQVRTSRRAEFSIRKGLVIFQFGVSSFLILGTLTVYRQLHYLQTKDLGLDRENVVLVRVEGSMADQFEAVRQSLLEEPSIEEVSRSSAHPLGITIKNSNAIWEGKEPGENVLFTVLETDDGFSDVMAITLSAGRFFDDRRDNGLQRYVINEAAARAMSLDEPVGHRFAFGFEEGGLDKGQIIGVVNDFHSGSLRDEEIGPLIFRYAPSEAYFLLVRVAANMEADALRALQAVQSRFNPGYIFDYSFLDEAYLAYYRDEQVLANLSRLFALLAVFIACLGLLGLSAFSIQQRTKEIGVRRILGASHRSVLYLLSAEFVKPIIIALMLALPMACWSMQHWLESFAYHIDMSVSALLYVTTILVAVALFTVGYQVMRAARLNPVESLHQE